MFQLRRCMCTAVQKQSVIPKGESHPRLPLKFISQLPVNDLKNETHVKLVEQSIRHRKSEFPFEALKQQFQFLQEVNQQMDILDHQKKEVNKKFLEAPTDQIKEKFKHEAITIREDIRRLREVITSLKEDVSSLAQNMPNVLHERIPLEQPYFISEWGSQEPKSESSSTYPSFPHCTFSTGKHAWFDLMIPIKVMQFLKSKGFIQTSNPDFLRRFVAREGSISETDYSSIYEENLPTLDQQLQLVGGGSFASYLPYFTRFSIYPTALPLKFVTIGRQYDSFTVPNSKEKIPSQAQVVQFFIATKSAEETNASLDDMISVYEEVYRKLGQSFKLSLTPAPLLKNSECLRVDVTQQSSFTGEFSHVANIRYFGDYVSKRILFNYRVGKNYGLPHILAGTIVHVPRLLQNLDLEKFDLEKF